MPSKLLFLARIIKSRIKETLTYLAYADSSTNAKWLKTVDRKKRLPIPWALVRFKIQVSLLILRRRKFTFQLSKHYFG